MPINPSGVVNTPKSLHFFLFTHLVVSHIYTGTYSVPKVPFAKPKIQMENTTIFSLFNILIVEISHVHYKIPNGFVLNHKSRENENGSITGDNHMVERGDN